MMHSTLTTWFAHHHPTVRFELDRWINALPKDVTDPELTNALGLWVGQSMQPPRPADITRLIRRAREASTVVPHITEARSYTQPRPANDDAARADRMLARIRSVQAAEWTMDEHGQLAGPDGTVLTPVERGCWRNAEGAEGTLGHMLWLVECATGEIGAAS